MEDLIYTQKLYMLLLSMHAAGLIQFMFMGFNVPLVHCGITQSDLLHVKSYAFEGFVGILQFESVMLRMCCHQQTVHSVLQLQHIFDTLIHQKRNQN